MDRLKVGRFSSARILDDVDSPWHTLEFPSRSRVDSSALATLPLRLLSVNYDVYSARQLTSHGSRRDRSCRSSSFAYKQRLVLPDTVNGACVLIRPRVSRILRTAHYRIEAPVEFGTPRVLCIFLRTNGELKFPSNSVHVLLALRFVQFANAIGFLFVSGNLS